MQYLSSTVMFLCRYHGYIAQAESDGADVEDSSGAHSSHDPNAPLHAHPLHLLGLTAQCGADDTQVTKQCV